MAVSTIDSNSLNATSDLTINGVTVGKGGGAVSTNTAVGASALTTNSSGANNTAVGYQAGYSGVTAPRNTSIGYRAGYANTTGYNCFIGTTSGTASTGYGNTFVGSDYANGCGALVTSGNNNTILGGYSGNQGGLDIRTASNYIVLSDGDGNPRMFYNSTYTTWYAGNSTASSYWPQQTSVSGNNCASVNGNDGTLSATGNASFLGGWNRNNGAGDFHRFYLSGTQIGSISGSGSTTTYSTSSDYRLKENITPMTGALAKVAQLKPVTYKWKSDNTDGQGFIAHELQKVVPDCVTGTKDAVDKDGNPEHQGIDTSFLVATLTAAIQELKAEFDAYVATHP